jgi:hypothetical protein
MSARTCGPHYSKPVESVEPWLAYLTAIERSPNTVKGYATT